MVILKSTRKILWAENPRPQPFRWLELQTSEHFVHVGLDPKPNRTTNSRGPVRQKSGQFGNHIYTCDPWNTHRATLTWQPPHARRRQQLWRYGYGPKQKVRKWYVMAQIIGPFSSFHIRNFNSLPTWAPLMDPCPIHSTPCEWSTNLVVGFLRN